MQVYEYREFTSIAGVTLWNPRAIDVAHIEIRSGRGDNERLNRPRASASQAIADKENLSDTRIQHREVGGDAAYGVVAGIKAQRRRLGDWQRVFQEDAYQGAVEIRRGEPAEGANRACIPRSIADGRHVRSIWPVWWSPRAARPFPGDAGERNVLMRTGRKCENSRGYPVAAVIVAARFPRVHCRKYGHLNWRVLRPH